MKHEHGRRRHAVVSSSPYRSHGHGNHNKDQNMLKIGMIDSSFTNVSRSAASSAAKNFELTATP